MKDPNLELLDIMQDITNKTKELLNSNSISDLDIEYLKELQTSLHTNRNKTKFQRRIKKD